MIDQKEKGKPQKMLYDQATKRGGCKLLGKLYCGKIVHQEKILHLQFTAKKDRKKSKINNKTKIKFNASF